VKIHYAIWETPDDEPVVFLGRTEKQVRDKLWACLGSRIGVDHIGDSLDEYIANCDDTDEYITIDSQELE
jgi:hypothetical protein